MELRYNMTDGSYLEHYGVPGMKWGVRHDKERLNSHKASSSKKNIFETAYREKNQKITSALRKDKELKKSSKSLDTFEKKHKLNFEDPEFSWKNVKDKNVEKQYDSMFKAHGKLEKTKMKTYNKRYKKEVYDKYISRYGKKAFKQSKRKYVADGAKKVAKLSGFVLTAPVSVPAFLIVQNVKAKKKK